MEEERESVIKHKRLNISVQRITNKETDKEICGVLCYRSIIFQTPKHI